jgi:hypothetical protein
MPLARGETAIDFVGIILAGVTESPALQLGSRWLAVSVFYVQYGVDGPDCLKGRKECDDREAENMGENQEADGEV